MSSSKGANPKGKKEGKETSVQVREIPAESERQPGLGWVSVLAVPN